ncbi:hypothetical protein [Robiginitalea sp. IMCC43444]
MRELHYFETIQRAWQFILRYRTAFFFWFYLMAIMVYSYQAVTV